MYNLWMEKFEAASRRLGRSSSHRRHRKNWQWWNTGRCAYELRPVGPIYLTVCLMRNLSSAAAKGKDDFPAPAGGGESRSAGNLVFSPLSMYFCA